VDRALELVAAHPDVRMLRVDLGGVGRIDVSGAYALRSLVRDAERAGIEAVVEGIPPRATRYVTAILSRLD
jgi:anti-anti-sigma regulatory factor